MASNKKNCVEIQNLAQENASSEGSKQNGRVWIWGGSQDRKVCVECEHNSLRLFLIGFEVEHEDFCSLVSTSL